MRANTTATTTVTPVVACLRVTLRLCDGTGRVSWGGSITLLTLARADSSRSEESERLAPGDQPVLRRPPRDHRAAPSGPSKVQLLADGGLRGAATRASQSSASASSRVRRR